MVIKPSLWPLVAITHLHSQLHAYFLFLSGSMVRGGEVFLDFMCCRHVLGKASILPHDLWPSHQHQHPLV